MSKVFFTVVSLLVPFSGFAHEYLSSESSIRVLKRTSFFDVIGNMGIETQSSFGLHLEAKGEICSISTFGDLDSDLDSNAGTKYGVVSHGVPIGSTEKTIQWSLTLRNLGANPHIVILRCSTDRNFSLTVGEIEKDLSHLIRFYKP